MNFLNDWIAQLNAIPQWSATVLTFALCIVVGYALRFIRQFPNDGIPLAVILTGGLGLPLLSNPGARADGMTMRLWVVTFIVAGLIIGAIAWFSHNMVLSRLEDYFKVKFLNKDSNDTPKPPTD